MEYVKMPELLSGEAARVLAGNMEAVRDMLKARHEEHEEVEGAVAPRKIKFIFVLNNVVIININAVAEEEEENDEHRR